jgi:hypothetical protein
MTPRSSRATWALLAAIAGVYLAGEVLLAAATEVSDEESPLVSVVFVVMTITYLGVGGLVVTRLPANPIGWLFCAAGLVMGVTSVSYGYAALVLTDGTEPSATGAAAAWVSTWSWSPLLLGVPSLLFLWFPDGRPISPRWRWVAGLVAVGVGCVLLGSALREGGMHDSPAPDVVNPLGVLPRGTAEWISTSGFVLGAFATGLAAWSVVLRFRRARSVERQQLKWFMWAASALPLYLTVGLLHEALTDGDGGIGSELALAASMTVVPVAAGAAILRYRLYDIDLVINRTLVYVSLTATLAASYLCLVLVLRLTLDPLTSGSDLAVAGSTLAVAALFGPLRTRIQFFVDRRFYRARYDAARTLEAFATHLRDELDLESLQRDLRLVVLDTVHPTRVSLWLRESVR